MGRELTLSGLAEDMGVSRQYVSKLAKKLPEKLQPRKQGRAMLLSPAAQVAIRDMMLQSQPKESAESTAVYELRQQLKTQNARIHELSDLAAKQQDTIEKQRRDSKDEQQKREQLLIQLTTAQAQVKSLQSPQSPDSKAEDPTDSATDLNSHAETSNESTSSDKAPSVDRKLTLGERLKALFSGHI